MKTLAQKARETTGHEEGCQCLHYDERSPNARICTCPDLPLHVRVAAGPGFDDLRREHEQDVAVCTRGCGAAWDGGHDPLWHAKPCAPPLDAARAWRLFQIVAKVGAEVVYHEGYGKETPWLANLAGVTQIDYQMDPVATPEEAVALLYEALHDAGLLTNERKND